LHFRVREGWMDDFRREYMERRKEGNILDVTPTCASS
jgi:hypothetical protein